MSECRLSAQALHRDATALLHAGGLAQPRATVVAEILVEAELIGRPSHGVALLNTYLAELQRGAMARDGEPAVLRDRGSVLVWDGRHLPGAWLVTQAIDEALSRLPTHPVMTIVIRNSRHVGCHAVYLERATRQGALITLTDTNPGAAYVAPHGGRAAAFSPTPFAFGCPAPGGPVLTDISLAASSLAKARRARAKGERLPGKWLVTAEGDATDDPTALFTEPPGAILPLGGADAGHKGFALIAMVQALAAGLSGSRAADNTDGMTSAVFLQLIDIEAFAGTTPFAEAMEDFATACRETAPAPGVDRVRLPGERATATRDRNRRDGIALDATAVETMRRWSASLGVTLDWAPEETNRR